MIYLNMITRHLLYTNASLLLLSLQEQSLAEQKELQMEELRRSWNKLIELVYIILNIEYSVNQKDLPTDHKNSWLVFSFSKQDVEEAEYCWW